MPPTTSDQSPYRRGQRDAESPAVGSPDAAGPIGSRPGARRPRRGAPLPIAAAVAAAIAATLSYLPVALTLGLLQFAEASGSVMDAARLGLAGWLLGHGVPLGTAEGPIALSPLALGMLSAWRVTRAGVHTSRAIGARGSGSLLRALAAAAAVGVVYGLFGAAAALGATGRGLTLSPVRAGATLAVFGAVAALIGAVRTTGALWTLSHRAPAALWEGLRIGVIAAALLLATGAAVSGLAVATAGGAASEMIAAYRTGVAGQAGITVISAAYVPNAAIWATAYLLGPGFAVGTDSVVRTTEVTVGALPALPLLAALPHGPVGGVGAALLAMPLIIGMIAGWLLVRRVGGGGNRGPDGWALLLTSAATAGPVAGMLLGAAAEASGGALGDGRLAQLGPVGWQVAAAATVLVTVGALLGVVAGRVFAPVTPSPRGVSEKNTPRGRDR
ncbi:MAG TPA: DUF6350 family protein [Micromonosporaceae bacterium]